MCQGNSSSCLPLSLEKIQAENENSRGQEEAKAEGPVNWLAKVLSSYSVLSKETPSFWDWAHFMKRRSDTMTQNAMVVDTATVHRRTVFTRNFRDFQQLGVEVQNPSDKG